VLLFSQTTSSTNKRRPLPCWENWENRKLYAQQRAMPQDPQQHLRMQVRRFWQQRQAEYGTIMVQEAFHHTLSDFGVEVEHNVFSCPDCWWEDREVIYCPWSWNHHDHPFHECPGMGQDCC